MAALELVSVTRGGPADRGCGFSESGWAGASDLLLFGGRSPGVAAGPCGQNPAPGFSVERGAPTEAWVWGLDGAGALKRYFSAGATGLAAVDDATGAAARVPAPSSFLSGRRQQCRFVLADGRVRLVAPGGQATTFDYGMKYRPSDRRGQLAVLDIVDDGKGAAGAIAVLNADSGGALEIYAAASSTEPLELVTSGL